MRYMLISKEVKVVNSNTSSPSEKQLITNIINTSIQSK